VERKRDNPKLFPKEIFTVWGFAYQSMMGLTAHFLGNQGGSNATLLPERVIFQNAPSVQPFKS